MPTLLLELLSEEIPPHMQKQGAEELSRRIDKELANLHPREHRLFWSARHIALMVDLDSEIPAQNETIRGPRVSAPDKAREGFCRKYDIDSSQLTQEGDFYVLSQAKPAIQAKDEIARIVPEIIRHFSWPKSMRWGQGSHLTWIRPLRHILCLLEGEVIHFSMAHGDDNGHHLVSRRCTQGHPFLNPELVDVPDAHAWVGLLYNRQVIIDPEKRRALIANSLHEAAREKGLQLIDDPQLLDEVNGMVEWPIIHIGTIDAEFMTLPQEVLQISMRHHQKYFSLRDKTGKLAPYFAFVSNMSTPDHGRQIVAGNERVLRARFADGLYFYGQDKKTPLAERVNALKRITFQESVGTEFQRTERLIKLATLLAPLCHASAEDSAHAAKLSKTDLTTDMVDEFPELQGIMGGYYAHFDQEKDDVALAISQQYLPRGPQDTVPEKPVSITLGLADRIDTLCSFFAAGKKPTGSKDPFGLRRAALGVIRLICHNQLDLDLTHIIKQESTLLPPTLQENFKWQNVINFLVERFQIRLRKEGVGHDRLSAILSVLKTDQGLNLLTLQAHIHALQDFLATPQGSGLVEAYKRAKNILRIENKKDKLHNPKRIEALSAQYFSHEETSQGEKELYETLHNVYRATRKSEDYAQNLHEIATLTLPIDQFFEQTLINDQDPIKRTQRLGLLALFLETIRPQADLSQIQNI